MATRTFYVTRDMKHPLYRSRMLTAGDRLELDAPTARLYMALKAISPDAPRAVKVAATPDAPVTPPQATTTKAAPTRKAATRKRTTKKAK